MFIYRIAYSNLRPLCPTLNTTCQGPDCMAFRERQIDDELTLAYCAMHGKPDADELEKAKEAYFKEEAKEHGKLKLRLYKTGCNNDLNSTIPEYAAF